MFKAHIVSHTHWDREWYKPFQHFRTRLVFMVDKLIEILENDPDYKCFMMDGQTVILEDYLSIKPQNYVRIKKLIEDERIIVGPWYTQPDEFMPDGESLIRNLLIGDRISKKFGKPMKVGYLPDSFGQCAQMPQILRGFEIDSAVIMRGVPFYKIKNSEFLWEGINGDKVIAVYLPLGYHNGCFLPDDFDIADKRITSTVMNLKEYASTENILIMNGIDHQWPQSYIPNYIKHINKKDKRTEYIHSTLECYVDSVKKSNPSLKVEKGELITPENSRVHLSMASTRIYQKQKNRKCEALLEKYVEPLCSIGWINNAEYPSELINKAWQYLLKNQAHDSICGCCTDEVHKEIDQRFNSIEAISETLVKSYSRAIARKIDSNELYIIVFNNSMAKGKQLVKATIILDSDKFIIKDFDGNIVPYQIEKVLEINVASLSIWSSNINLNESKKKVDIVFYVDFDFNVGYKLYEIKETNENYNEATPLVATKNIMENEFYRIEINKNGSIDVLDKLTKKIYKDLNIFEDRGDAGDTYNFSPIENEEDITSEDCIAKCKVVELGPIMAKMKIDLNMMVPERLINNKKRSDKKVVMPITTYITIYSDIKRIDFKTIINNTAYDHRVRVLFPSCVNSDNSVAEIQFGTLKRSNIVLDKWKSDWAEKPLPIYSEQRFVDVNDGNIGLAVLNRGLPEYEIYEKECSVIALTLFRGVGVMGKRDLSIRPGRASGVEMMPTPDAQCIGRQVFEYSILPHIGNYDDAFIAAEAAKYDAEPLCVQNLIKIKNLSEEVKSFEIETLTKHIENQIGKIAKKDYNFIKLSTDKLLISALKKAENDESLIVRLYNSGEKAIINSRIFINADVEKAILTNFNEDSFLKRLDKLSDNEFVLPEVKPNTAITVKFIFSK